MTDEVRIATVEIAGPGRNLLNPEVLGNIEQGIRDAAADTTVAGIVLIGSGDDAFCGGLDVPAIKAGADPVPFYEGLISILKLLPALPKPVVAAVNGDALAGGAGFVAAADYVVSVPDAKIGSYEVSVGVWPIVAQVPLVKRLGVRAAMENIVPGEPFTAERAKEVGLVNDIVPVVQLRETAEEWLRKAARGGATVAGGRPSLYEVDAMSYNDALDAALTRITAAYQQ
ncbi:MAG: enoyl-CoA hydratase/isomerase family protein [Nocardioidaceae bacterium]|jgi:methylglutaconyl-CoA hydratase|nr:enoyl-CoA hydratase/isomerase family protein [Nocardioidaceae bacterium]